MDAYKEVSKDSKKSKNKLPNNYNNLPSTSQVYQINNV